MMKKVYCKNCKNRRRYSRRYLQCVKITKNKFTGIKTVSLSTDGGSDFSANNNGDCSFYEKKFWKFWVSTH